MIYAVISQEYAGKKGNIKEKWYGTEYNNTKIDKVCSGDLLYKISFFFCYDNLKF